MGWNSPFGSGFSVSLRDVLAFVGLDQRSSRHRKVLAHFRIDSAVFRRECAGPCGHRTRWAIPPEIVLRTQSRKIGLPLKHQSSEHRPCRALIVGLLLVLNLSVPALFAKSAFSLEQKSFLWRVRSESATVYLLGSIHFLKENVYPLNEAIEKAFESSDVLVVEANINDLDKVDLTKLTNRALYQGDDQLEKHISQETWLAIMKESGALGLPSELIRKQKPWFLALTLQALELVKLGYEPRYGVDFHYLAEARGKKRVLELESLEEQISLLSGFSEREQELFLLYTLRNLRSMSGQVEALVQAWALGDSKAVESILAESAHQDREAVPIFGKLFDERNLRMSSRIESYLGSTGSYFVIVGAGHLVGKTGIIELIKDKGYDPEQL